MQNKDTISPYDHFLTNVKVHEKFEPSLNKTYESMKKARENNIMREVVCVGCRKKMAFKNTTTVPWWKTNSLVCFSCFDRIENHKMRKAS